MSWIDEAYWKYVNWSLKIGVAPLNPLQYEKVLDKIPTPAVNNTDKILMNSQHKKDK